MRGYLSFLLVLGSALIILNFLIVQWQPQSISLERSVAIERVYQVQMNAKQVVVEAIREGALEAFSLYDKTHSVEYCDPQIGGPADPLCFRIEEARTWTMAGAYLKMTELDTNIDPEMKMDIWCKDGISEDIARAIARSGSCPQCEQFKSIGDNLTGTLSNWPPNSCQNVISPEIIPDIDPLKNPVLKSVKISGGSAGSIGGSIGILVHYPAFNISSVTYLPAGYEVFP